jgi:hypothetical protein
LRRPLNEPSPLSLPLAPKNRLVNPLLFSVFCLSVSPISPLPHYPITLSPLLIYRGLRRPLNDPSPLSLPLAPKNGLVPPKVFLICFCFFLDVTDYTSPITVFDFWGLRLSPAWVVAPPCSAYTMDDRFARTSVRPRNHGLTRTQNSFRTSLRVY